MKRLAALMCAIALLAAFAVPSYAADEKIVVKVAGSKPDGNPQTIGLRHFEKRLEELSNGKYDVQVYPHNQLGKEDNYLTQTRNGTIQMCAVGPQSSRFHPAMAMFETPMLYKDLDHAHRAMNGGVLELITGPAKGQSGKFGKSFVENSGMRVLNAYPIGFRHFFTKKDIKTMDDLKGLRMRVPNVPLYVKFAEFCDISGQPINYVDLPSALDQGVVDGGDSPFGDIISDHLYEYAPIITISGHILVLQNTMINEKFWQSLPEQDKKWFEQAAKEASEVVWDECAKVDERARKVITDAGGKVNTPDKAFFDGLYKAGEKSWEMFLNKELDGKSNPAYVPNAREILDMALSFKDGNPQATPAK